MLKASSGQGRPASRAKQANHPAAARTPVAPDGAGTPAGSGTLSMKERIVEAAFETLKEEGFAGTSARAIARRGNFNQALIFYHFGTLSDLLLATLDKTSADRMSRYREAIKAAETVDQKIATATLLYREDLSSGRITVISELVAGSLARPDLASEVVARMEPWIDFTGEVIQELVAKSPFEGLIPPRDLAFAVVALYIGVDLLSHLDPDKSRAEALFQLAGGVVPLLGPVFGWEIKPD